MYYYNNKQLVNKKLKKEKTAEEIADILEEDLESVQNLIHEIEEQEKPYDRFPFQKGAIKWILSSKKTRFII